MLVHGDPAQRPEREPRRSRQRRVRPHAGGDDDQLGRQHAPVGDDARDLPPLPLEAQQGLARVDGDPLRPQRRLGDAGDRRVEELGEHVAEPFDHGGLQVPDVREPLGHLQPDRPAADDDGVPDVLADERPLEVEGVLQVVHDEDVAQVAPRHRRRRGDGPRPEHERVVRQRTPPAALEVLDLQLAARAVDRDGARARQHRHPLGLAEERRVAQRVEARAHQLRLVGDLVGEVVGDAAAAVGDEAPLVDDGDLGLREQPPEPAGDLRPEGDRADDHDTQAHGRIRRPAPAGRQPFLRSTAE